MKEYINSFFEYYDYPQEARQALTEAFDKINSDNALSKAFSACMDEYKENIHCSYKGLNAKVEEIAHKAQVHPYTALLVFYICLSRLLKENYAKKGIDLNIFYDSMLDLRYKLYECKDVYGIWGTFVALWFCGFFNLTRFAFGRLQIETAVYNGEYKKGDVYVKQGSTVLAVHIPRTGTSITPDVVHDSYRRAAEFFKDNFKDGYTVFTCKTWLFYPKNKEILNPKSNMYSFMSEYDITDWGEYNTYQEVWRLFDKMYDGDINKLPADTSLRRGYIQWIKDGVKTGWGNGILIYKNQ